MSRILRTVVQMSVLILLAGQPWVLSGADSAATAPASQPKAVRVACVGDSITVGVGAGKGGYPAMLGKMLGEAYEVKNFGSSGATLLNKGDRPYRKQPPCASALAYKPDVVVIMLGTNDSKNTKPDNWQHKADFVGDYQALIAEFRKVKPDTKIYCCLPVPAFPGKWGINNPTILNEILPKVRQAAEGSRATVIDCYAPLTDKKDFFPDTVHPNADGAAVIAATVYTALTGKAPPAPATQPASAPADKPGKGV